MTLDLTACPECGAAAEVEWRAVLDSTDGPVEHARIRCIDGRWFLLPTAHLASVPTPASLRSPAQEHPR
jgi:hypothetical protein